MWYIFIKTKVYETFAPIYRNTLRSDCAARCPLVSSAVSPLVLISLSLVPHLFTLIVLPHWSVCVFLPVYLSSHSRCQVCDLLHTHPHLCLFWDLSLTLLLTSFPYGSRPVHLCSLSLLFFLKEKKIQRKYISEC